MKSKIILIVTTVLLLASCNKKTEWDTDWVVALFHDDLNLSNLENDSTLVNDGGYYHVQLRRNLVDLNLTNFVQIPDTTIAYTKFMQIAFLQVNPGFEFMNSVEDHELQLQDIQLKKIHVSSGKITCRMENPVQTAIDITLILPGAKRNGTVLSKQLQIGPKVGSQNGVIETVIDLAGYDIDLDGTGGASFNKLQSQVVIKTSLSGSPVTVTNQDGFVVNASFKDVKVDYARGYFGSRVINEVEDFDLDILKMVQSGTLDIPHTQIKFNVSNGVKVDLSAQLNELKSTNVANNAVLLSGGIIGNQLNVPSATGQTTSLQPGNYSFVFNSTNSNIEQFIEHLGYKYDLKYLLKINPWGNTTGGWNEIYTNSRVRVAVELDMPLAIGLNALVLQDTFDISAEMSTEKSHILEGKLMIQYENSFPISANLSVQFLDANGQVIGTTSMLNGIQSSAFAQNTSVTLPIAKGEVSIPLTKEILGNTAQIKKAVVTAHLNSTNDASVSSEMINIPYGAALKLKARAHFTIRAKI